MVYIIRDRGGLIGMTGNMHIYVYAYVWRDDDIENNNRFYFYIFSHRELPQKAPRAIRPPQIVVAVGVQADR